MKTIIVGGGIGGLVAAISLHDAGFDVEVFESVRELRLLGVGINLLPHAVRELDELGLGSQLERIGIATAELVYFSKHGKRIWSEPRGRAAGYRWPQISIHRGHLQMFLLQEARARLGANRIHAGHHLQKWHVTDAGVVARFADPISREPRATVEGEMLIAADGIHSTARRILYPDEGPPRWPGPQRRHPTHHSGDCGAHRSWRRGVAQGLLLPHRDAFRDCVTAP